MSTPERRSDPRKLAALDALIAKLDEQTSALVREAIGDCRACDAPLVWALHPPSGGMMPLEPPPPGVTPGQGSFAVARVGPVLTYHSGAGQPRWVSHFATCPDASKFRRVKVREHERIVGPRRASPPESVESGHQPPPPAPRAPSRARARHTHPETSHDAARSLSPDRLTESQEAVLATLRRIGPSSDVRLFQSHRPPPKLSESGMRSRRAELVLMGLVRDSGERTKLASGRDAIVWEATP